MPIWFDFWCLSVCFYLVYLFCDLGIVFFVRLVYFYLYYYIILVYFFGIICVYMCVFSFVFKFTC